MGYIGSFTVLALLQAGYKVVIVDNLYNASKECINRIELISGKRPEFFSMDITNEAEFDKVFEAHPDIDSVIHFAALKVRLLSLIEFHLFHAKVLARLSVNPARSLWSTTE